MINHSLVEEKLNEEAKKILLLIKKDYYNHMSLKMKQELDDLINTEKVVIVNKGLSHFNDNTLAHGGRSLKDGKIHFYPDVRGFNTNEAIDKCKKIVLHECLHYFIQPNESELKTELEKEMASFFVEGLVEKESRKFYENHKDEIEFEKANYGYNINFVNEIQNDIGASDYEIVFSEEDYIKNIGKYSSKYKKIVRQKEINLELATEISKKFPKDMRRRVSGKMKNVILKDGNAVEVKEKLKTFEFISEKDIEKLDKISEEELELE